MTGKSNRDSLLWFVPAGALVAAIVAFPLVRTIFLSFVHENFSTGFRAEFAGFNNFVRLLFDSRFRDCLWTTSLFTTLSVGAEFAIGLLLALAANSLRTFRSYSRVILLTPWTLPTAVIAVLWALIFNDQFGVLNAVLLRTGVLHEPVVWLGQPATAMFAIIAADVWKTAPFVFLILLAGLQNIPRDL